MVGFYYKKAPLHFAKRSERDSINEQPLSFSPQRKLYLNFKIPWCSMCELGAPGITTNLIYNTHTENLNRGLGVLKRFY